MLVSHDLTSEPSFSHVKTTRVWAEPGLSLCIIKKLCFHEMGTLQRIIGNRVARRSLFHLDCPTSWG
ncbi:hypothetical protein Plhal304r1_c010g0039621 [Plasmopara halstedii]